MSEEKKGDMYNMALKKIYYSELAEMHDDMVVDVHEMLKIAREHKIELNTTARNYFASAYKNIVSKLRSSYRILNLEKQKSVENGEIINNKLNSVVSDILKYSEDVLNEIKEMEPLDKNNKTFYVFIKKMEADYCRYRAEVLSGDEQSKEAQKAQDIYIEAKKVSDELSSTDPVRLGVCLNYSVFCYEIIKDADEACKIAKDAFELAISELDTLSEENYRDSTLIMQLLRDNLALWTTRNEVKKPE